MSETLKKVKNIIEITNKINVKKLSKDKNAFSDDSPLMFLLIESVEMNMKVLDTLPDLDEDKMKANLIKLLDDDMVKTKNKIKITEIKSNLAKMIDKFFETKKKANSFKFKTMIDKFFKIKTNVNSSNKTKKMVGGDRDTCAICLEINQFDSPLGLVCCPSEPRLHVFHKDCALNWLHLRGECPECRANWNPWRQGNMNIIHPGDYYPPYNHLDHRANPLVPLIHPREDEEEGQEEEELVTGLSSSQFIQFMTSPLTSRGFHLGITHYLCLFLCCIIDNFGEGTMAPYNVAATIINVNLYFLSSLPFTSNNADHIITIYRVQQFIYSLCIISILLSVSEPTTEDLMHQIVRGLQRVTVLILNNSSDVNNENARQMFDQQLTLLMEHQDGGSMKTRRKSRKKRGRKSNRKKLDRKKLNRKTRRKVMKF